MCLSIFLSQYPNKLSNYVLLVVISYKMIINSENNLFEIQPRTKQATNRRLPFDLTSSVLFLWCSGYGANLFINRSAVRNLP